MSSGCSRNFPNAQPALGYGLTETNAVGCTNFWGNYAAKPASTGRAQKPVRRGRDPRRRTTRICRPAKRGEIAHPQRPPTSNAIGAIRKRPRRRSPPTATSAPATSAISTRTAICSSSTARRTSSSAAARISRAAEVEAASTPARTSPKPRCSARPTSGSAKCRSRSSMPAKAAASTRTSLRDFLERQARRVQDSGADHLLATSPCRGSAPARSTARARRRKYAH